jgi:hypothetical protein
MMEKTTAARATSNLSTIQSMNHLEGGWLLCTGFTSVLVPKLESWLDRAISSSIGTEDVYVGSGLIHGIIKGLFAKYIMEEPNHGTLTLFIIR